MQNRSSEMRFKLLLRQIRRQTYQDYTSTWPSKRRFCNITSILEVKSEISRIKTSKATGHDRISPKLLKDSMEVVAESLTNIFNKSIEKGVFPDDLKITCISPIHKGDSKLECCNYRPISIISVVAKVFEKLISRQLNGYLESNHWLSDSQAGFRKNSSTTTPLLNNTNKWYINHGL
jgi:ribonuclease HII